MIAFVFCVVMAAAIMGICVAAWDRRDEQRREAARIRAIVLASIMTSGCSVLPAHQTLLPPATMLRAAHLHHGRSAAALNVESFWVPESRLYEGPSTPPVLFGEAHPFTSIYVENDLILSPVNICAHPGPSCDDIIQVLPGVAQRVMFPETGEITIEQAYQNEDPGTGIEVGL